MGQMISAGVALMADGEMVTVPVVGVPVIISASRFGPSPRAVSEA